MLFFSNYANSVKIVIQYNISPVLERLKKCKKTVEDFYETESPTGTAREGREKQGVRLRGSPLFSLDPRAAPLYDVQYLPFA